MQDERIEHLIQKMTLQEKVSLVSGVDFWHTAGIRKLGIPSIKMTDGPHGARTMADQDPNETLPATCFPTGIAMGATWNTELIQRVGMAIAKETKARGCSILLGPCVNIHRSPLGGRNFESFSEDPCLSSELAAAYIRGVQGEGVYACIKHFALNNSEYQRMTISSDVDERVAREIYFPSFKKAVQDAEVGAVMCSYNRINGTYASENRWLLTDILKQEWGFRGPVVSDWFAVHATEPAVNSGLDLEMPGPARKFGDKLIEAIRHGRVEEKTIDDKVRRLLRVIRESDVSDEKPATRGIISDIPEHRNLALEVAGEAIVLLKNNNDILPLDTHTLHSIAVIGPNAAWARIQGDGSSAVEPFYTVSPLQGLKNRCPEAVKITHEPGCRNNLLTLRLNPFNLVSEKDSDETGLIGEYFDNIDFRGKPLATKVDSTFNFKWFEKGPLPGMNMNNCAIRWTGFFKAEETGIHTFGLISSGMARVSINDTVVCRYDGGKPEDAFARREENKGDIELTAGQTYPVTIEFRSSPDAFSPIGILRVGCNPPLPPDLEQRAINAAAGADVAIVFAGLMEEYESEGFDRTDLDLPAAQRDLIAKVAEANANTIVVLNNGSPLKMESWSHKVPAIVEAWYPGQECGNAIAAVLFGDINPSGKLPDTFPQRIEDNPAFPSYPGENGRVKYDEGILVGYRHYDMNNISPSFPFGHGLSYTSFEYSNLTVTQHDIKSGEHILVTVDIRNTGKRSGKEVVQLYVRDVQSSLLRPVKELKGFQKISLAPGETRTVSFILNEEVLSFFDPGVGKWVAEAGKFEILVGASSRDIRRRAFFTFTKG